MSRFTSEDKRRAAAREAALRRNVYRKRVAEGRMRQEDADREIAIMDEIAADYAVEEQQLLNLAAGMGSQQ